MSFRLKTILGIASIESALLILLIISALNFLSDSNEQQLIQRAETTSRLFANATKDALLATDLATLESFIDETLSNPAIVYTRILSNGVVLAEGGRRDVLNRPHELDSNLDDVSDGVFDVRATITEGGVQYGVIEMGLSTSPIEGLLSDAKRWTIGIASLEVVLVAVFSFLLGTYLTRQLQQLKLASETIARFGPGHQISIHGNDEIAEVANAFNSMSLRLQQNYAELENSLHTQKELNLIAKRNQAKNEAILSASLDAMITIDPKGYVIEYNKIAEQIFGWSTKEIVGRPMCDFIIPPEMRDAHEKGMAHYLSTREGPVLGQRLELSAQHKEGHCFPIEIAISAIDSEQGPMFTAFIRDITQRLAAETELRLAAQTFASSEAMFIAGADANIIRINAAFTRITGYSEEEVLGKNPRIFSSGQHTTEFYAAMWSSILVNGYWRGEIYNKRKNGEIFPEHLNISAVKDSKGDTTHYIAHFMDISEQKKNEQQLREAQREAITASKAKSQFLAAMSHEIRTPMNSVLGVLGLLKDTTLTSHQTELVRTGRDSGQLLLSIINDILDFSKMEADKLQLEHTSFDLHRLLATSTDLLRPMASKKGLALILFIDSNLPRCAIGDPDRLRQILINLVNNAIKFTASGNITVRAKPVRRDDKVGTLLCTVQDTGIGIPMELQTNLFEEFTMADQSHSRHYEGTGLGLAISKRLTSLMGGSIFFSSEVDVGSTFAFTVKLDATDNQDCIHIEEDAEQKLLPMVNKRILLAEDNPANQLVIRSILEHAGLQVDIVANGLEAVEAVQRLPYDIVLMDISMPDMDGMEATRHIRQLPGAICKLPVVALTAHSLAGDKKRFLDAGMDDYLSKPIDRAATLRCIARWTNPANDTDMLQVGTNLTGETTKAEATPADTEHEYVDELVLQQLARDTAPEIVPELLTLYIDDARKRLVKIKTAVSGKNAKDLEYECHTLGSSAAAHGNSQLHIVARKVEHLCMEGEHKQALTETTSLLKIAERSLSLLAERLDKGFA